MTNYDILKRLLFFSIFLLINSFTAFGIVWKGINLDYLTDAHQESIKGYPCEIKFQQYYINVNFGDICEGSLEEQSTSHYDELGYKTKDGDYSIKNEYQDGKIVKRTWTRSGETIRVHCYEYDSTKGIIILTKYNQWGLDDVFVYSITGGKLFLKKKADSSIIQKFNLSGLIEWEFDTYNDHKTKTYVKGFLKREKRNHTTTPNKVFSGYKTDSFGNWIKRIISNEDESTPLQGYIYEEKIGKGYNRIQKRLIIYK